MLKQRGRHVYETGYDYHGHYFNLMSTFEHLHRSKECNKMLERSKRFAFLKSAGCGVSLIVFFNYIEHFSDLIMNAFNR